MSAAAQGLLFAYALTAVPMAAALIRRRAAVSRFLAWPLVAVPVAVLAALLVHLVRTAWSEVFEASPPRDLLHITAAALYVLVGFVAGHAFAHGAPAVTIARGAVVEEGRSLQRRARAPLRRDPTLLSLAGIPIPPLDETKHFKLIGTTGTGKSTAIRELLTRALARGDRALIADPDGGYLERFYDPTRGDVILNPFEARSRRWDLFAEIEQPYDVDQLARSLIPDSGSRGEQEWRQYARTFFTAVTRQLHEAGVRDLAELYRLITMAPVEELRALVGGTPAQPFLEPENARMFSSIRSVTTSALAALDYIQDQTAEPFSVREWVRRGAAAPTSRPPAGGVLFLPYQAAQIAALRAVIATWLRLAIFECMSQREGDQRLWIVIDELDALGTIDGLKDALARLRKFGGRCVLGFQSIAQVRSTYGDGDARTIVENCANTLILRCSASEGGGTAQFASQLIGEQQVIRPTLSRSHRPGDLQATTTRSTHRTVEPAVLPSEIEQLPDLVGFLKLASCTAWLDVRLIKSPRAVTAPVR